MAKSIRDSTKSQPKTGRPKTTGPGQPQVVRMHDQQVASINAWIAQQREAISRPEAIRRLVEIGLTVKTKGRQSSDAQRLRAREMAASAIDRMTDATADADDQASRKRRLLKGPEEFRDTRVDRPKAKGK